MSKALTFKQEAQIEHYLYAYQELLLDPENEEVQEVVVELIRGLQEFLTDDEIGQYSQDLEDADKEPEPESIEFAIGLPPGWRAEDFTFSNPDTRINLMSQELTFSVHIHRKNTDKRYVCVLQAPPRKEFLSQH